MILPREMKDSEIKWIGRIPKHWQKARIGGAYTLRNTKVSDRDYQPLSVTMKGIVPQLETAAKTNAHDDRKLVKKGDFAINSRSDRRGSCGIASIDGSVSLINTVLKPNNEMNPEYHNWLFHTVQFADEFYANGHGIVDDLWTTGWQEMKRIIIPQPPIDEQKHISNYLDKKCANIDSITDDIEEQIKTLEEYKTSIITNIVNVGKMVRFKYIATIRSNLVNPSNYLSYLQIGPDSIEKNTGKLIVERTVEEAAVDSWNHLFFKGQIIYSKIRPVLNKVIIAPYDGLCSADMYPIETKQNTRFLKYAMLSSRFVYQVDMITRDRIKMPKINQDELGNIKVLIPELDEQDRIADYLDGKCAEIDKVIADKRKLLTLLDEYKKSLIYEYVTGKKEVPAT